MGTKFNYVDGYTRLNVSPFIVYQLERQQLEFNAINIERLFMIFGEGPHDMMGHQMFVGCKVAVALTSGRSSVMMYGEVVEIMAPARLKIKSLVRSDCISSKIIKDVNIYTFPDRMIRLSW